MIDFFKRIDPSAPHREQWEEWVEEISAELLPLATRAAEMAKKLEQPAALPVPAAEYEQAVEAAMIELHHEILVRVLVCLGVHDRMGDHGGQKWLRWNTATAFNISLKVQARLSAIVAGLR